MFYHVKVYMLVLCTAHDAMILHSYTGKVLLILNYFVLCARIESISIASLSLTNPVPTNKNCMQALEVSATDSH